MRSWCRWCVVGPGLGIQHLAAAGSTIPIIRMDYFFLTEGGVKNREELEFDLDEPGNKALDDAIRNEDIVKRMILRCFLTRNLFARVLPQKGLVEDKAVL